MIRRRWPEGCDARGAPRRDYGNTAAALIYTRVEVRASAGGVAVFDRGREVTLDELRDVIACRYGFRPARAHLTAALLALCEFKEKLPSG
jgi:hypothetical protein